MPKPESNSRSPFGTLRLVEDGPPRVASPLSVSTAGRLRSQLVRAFRHSFGAEQGLRVLVRLATTQMLAEGASRATIRRLLTQLVAEHPAGATSRSMLIDGQNRADALTAMMLRWSDRTGAGDSESDD